MRLLFILILFPVVLMGQQKTMISLQGTWQFQLDSLKIGESEQWYNRNLPANIQLPSSVDEGGFGKAQPNSLKTMWNVAVSCCLKEKLPTISREKISPTFGKKSQVAPLQHPFLLTT